jgi:hypothetical protein
MKRRGGLSDINRPVVTTLHTIADVFLDTLYALNCNKRFSAFFAKEKGASVLRWLTLSKS